jgi:tripartite-type tricarboxylate transporter receptor subunit TctC
MGITILLLFAAPALAGEWPARPIEIACFGAAGGGTDLVDRTIAKAMEPLLKVQINVANRAGGGGGVALDYVWSRPHDGYHWGGFSESIIPAPFMGAHPTTTKDWIYFMVGGAPGVVSVRPDAPYKTLDDLVKAAKAKPGVIKASASTTGGIWHTKLIALMRGAEIDFNFLPFNGSHPSQVAAMTGEVDVVVTSVSEQAELIEAKKLVPLAMIELQGYDFKGMKIGSAVQKYPGVAKLLPLDQWLGFAVPADTPKPILDRITDAYVKAMESELVKDLARTKNLTLYGYHGEQAQKIARSMERVWSWTLWDLKVAKKSPAEFGIEKP